MLCMLVPSLRQVLKAKLVTGLLLVILSGCTSNVEVGADKVTSANPYVPDSVTTVFVNEVLAKNFNEFTFTCDFVLDRPFAATLAIEDSLQLIRMDSIFSEEDVVFLYKQVAKGDSFKLNSDIIGERVLVSLDTILADAKGKTKFQAFKDRYGGEGFCYITMPVFSKDYSYAIVRKGFACGNICGEDETLIYKLIDGHWQLVYTLKSAEEI